jgi:hypothetical protein
MEPMEPAHEGAEMEETAAVHVLSPMIEFVSPPDKIKE